MTEKKTLSFSVNASRDLPQGAKGDQQVKTTDAAADEGPATGAIANLDTSQSEEKSQARTHESARALIDVFEQENVHPVLIFGTKASGKTLFITNMLGYLMQNPQGVQLQRDALNMPNTVIAFEERMKREKRLFDTDVYETAKRNKISAPTQISGNAENDKIPFYVGFKLIKDSSEYRMVFMESMGEWIERDQRDQLYQDFNFETTYLLSNWTRPMTVIFIVPAADDKKAKMETASDAIHNAVTQYTRLRRNRASDNLLLVASKWDLAARPDDKDREFEEAPWTSILKRFEGHGRQLAWASFAALQSGAQEAPARWLAPLCSVQIDDNDYVVEGTPSTKRTKERFKRTIWNWLYGNASAARVISESMQNETIGIRQNEKIGIRKMPKRQEVRKVLFPDVELPSLPTWNLYERIVFYMLELKYTVLKHRTITK
jgi:hypothetical protein